MPESFDTERPHATSTGRILRQQDDCLAVEEHELGVHAMAVPLRDLHGRTVAALNVVLPGGCGEPHSSCAPWLAVLQQAARGLRPLL